MCMNGGGAVSAKDLYFIKIYSKKKMELRMIGTRYTCLHKLT